MERNYVLVFVLVIAAALGIWFFYFRAEVVRNDYLITEEDNGKVFAYPLASRFTLSLDTRKYPGSPVCSPEGIVGLISGQPEASRFSAESFEVLAAGECILKQATFSVIIRGEL